MRSADHALADQLGRETFSPRRAHEQPNTQAVACPPAVVVAVMGLAAVLIALGVRGLASEVRIAAMVVLSGDHSPRLVINTRSLNT